MLSIFKKTISSSPAKISSSRSETPISNSDEELSTWQIVDDDDRDIDLYSLHSDESEIEEEIVIEEVEEVTCGSRDPAPIDDVMLLRSLSVSPPTIIPVEVTRHLVVDEEEVVEEEEDDDVYGYDVDDELVPWKLKDRYGKQRIKKMGKRGGGGGGAKFNKSNKSLPYYYFNRPGKLALSVQHTYL